MLQQIQSVRNLKKLEIWKNHCVNGDCLGFPGPRPLFTFKNYQKLYRHQQV